MQIPVKEMNSSQPDRRSLSENGSVISEPGEFRRKVSISQEAMDADNEKRASIRNSSFHSRSSRSSLAANNCDFTYSNSAFQNSIPLEKRATYSYTVSKPRQSFESTPRSEFSEDRSWIYLFCLKCRRKEVGPGWEPTFWPLFCPHPFCPSYRHVARIFALLVTILLTWGVIYIVIGVEAGPGGQLFNMAVLCLCAHFVGWIFRSLTLPGLLGMLVTGIAFQNLGLVQINGGYKTVASILRKISLVVLLTRAGLDMDPKALKKLYGRILTLGIFPWFIEALVMCLLTCYFFQMPFDWGMLLGCVIAAVSPAVVVPAMFRLRNKGYGVAKGIPTLVIAVAGIDDALSVTFYGLFHSFMFSHHSMYHNLMLGPASILGGLSFGFAWGFFAKYIPESQDPFVVPLRVSMLLMGGLLAVFGTEVVGFEGAGPLAVISAAFMSIYCWSKQGWNTEDNPVAVAFEIFWMFCEPVLFGLTGTQIEFGRLDLQIVAYGSVFIVVCFLLRILSTVAVSVGSSLNMKERGFVAVSLMAKASVQAVLAPAIVESAMRGAKNGVEKRFAEILLTICILSILITAPIGAIFITSFGTRLLSKTKQGIPSEGWRRSARPSLRDITIIEEVEEPKDCDQSTKQKQFQTVREG